MLPFETVLPTFVTSSPMMTANAADHFCVCSTFDSPFHIAGFTIFHVNVCLSLSNQQEQTY